VLDEVEEVGADDAEEEAEDEDAMAGAANGELNFGLLTLTVAGEVLTVTGAGVAATVEMT
jgi:hypothetical protein